MVTSFSDRRGLGRGEEARRTGSVLHVARIAASSRFPRSGRAG